MKGLFIPEITAEMFRNGCLESIEALMAEGEICDIDYEPEPRWIPVTERLPEPVAPSQRREWFLTSNQYGSVTLTCYEFETSPFREGWQTDMTILAWMPLPEPWKGEDDG